MCAFVCVCGVFVWWCVCMWWCVCVFVYVYEYVCMWVCGCVGMYVWWVHCYVYMYVCRHVCALLLAFSQYHALLFLWLYILYVYIYIYIYRVIIGSTHLRCDANHSIVNLCLHHHFYHAICGVWHSEAKGREIVLPNLRLSPIVTARPRESPKIKTVVCRSEFIHHLLA